MSPIYYYLIFCLTTYLTVLINIYIPVEYAYSGLRVEDNKSSFISDLLVVILRQITWGGLTIILAPAVFYSLLREDNAAIQVKLITDLLENE